MEDGRFVIAAPGGPDAMSWETIALPPPGSGEVRMRSTAIGLNFIDTYHRSGLYPVPLPSGLGVEAAGIVEAVGEGVHLRVGERVATFGPTLGAYATRRNVPAAELFSLPDDVSDRVAAAMMLKGCTAEALVERCASVQPGWTTLVHAAAGGVGLLLVQWLKMVGATVIATTSTEEKVAAVREAGADHVIRYKQEDTADAVRKLTGGEGVHVSFDGVGRASWLTSLQSVRRRGLIVSYGNASGPVAPMELASLARAGSVFVTRPTLFDYYREPGEREAGSARLFEMVRRGLKVTIGRTLPLSEVVEAHRTLEAGVTTGSTVLLP